MNKLFRAPIRTFVAGLLAVLPVVLTVAVIVWVASVVDQFVGPHRKVGKLLISIGLTIVETKIMAYLIGIIFVLSAVYVLGLFVEAGLQRRLQSFIDGLLRRIPLVGNVYDLTHRFVGMLDRKERTDLKTMSPVWCLAGRAVLRCSPYCRLRSPFCSAAICVTWFWCPRRRFPSRRVVLSSLRSGSSRLRSGSRD